MDDHSKPSHAYRHEMPNLLDDLELSPYAYRLYGHVKRVAGDAGWCGESTRALAEKCRMSVGQVSASKADLLKKKLIEVEPAGGNRPDRIRPTDIWQRNYDRYRKSPDSSSPECSPGEHKEPERSYSERYRSPGEQGVHTVNATYKDKEEPGLRTENNSGAAAAPAREEDFSKDEVTNNRFALEFMLRLGLTGRNELNLHQRALFADTERELRNEYGVQEAERSYEVALKVWAGNNFAERHRQRKPVDFCDRWRNEAHQRADDEQRGLQHGTTQRDSARQPRGKQRPSHAEQLAALAADPRFNEEAGRPFAHEIYDAGKRPGGAAD